MVLLILVAQAVSVLCIFLHYSQHFKCKKRTNHSNNILKSPTTSPHSSPRRKRNTSIFFADLKHHVNSTAFVRTFQSPQRCCKSCFRSIDDEEFDLFPISFLAYLVFIFITLTLVTINDFYAPNHNINLTQNPLYLLITTNNYINIYISTNPNKYMRIIDYIICYLILILYISESLFHFHRYYITQYASKHFFNPPFASILKHFSIYASVFSIVFLIQIHAYYWLFPLVVLLHCLFNMYCTWTFCAILIERYQFYNNVEQGLQSIHAQLLETVYTIRKASIISIIFSSILIFIFCITYNVYIISYIGLLWNVSNISFMFNFVRIRNWINSCLLFGCIHKHIKDNKSISNPKSAIVSANINIPPKNNTIAIHISEHKNDIPIAKFTPNTTNSTKLTPSKLTPSTCTIDVTPITEDDISPITDNDIIINSDNDNITPHKITANKKTGATNTSSKCLLEVPTPISMRTTCTNHNNNNNKSDDDIEYQKWYLNQHSTHSEPNTPNKVKKNSLVIPSLRISISNSINNKSKKGKFKLFNVENIDKTPLNNININAYDMTPINTINDIDDNKEFEMEMDSSDSEPSVEDINIGNKTPINEIVMGILKKASSLVKSYSNDANKRQIPKLQQRGRSYSDPTKYKTNSNSNLKIDAKSQKNEIVEIEHSVMSRSVNLIGINSGEHGQKSKLNKNVPQLTEHYSQPKRNTFGNIGSNIVRFTPNNNDDILISVLVSHGFCSRSSLKL